MVWLVALAAVVVIVVVVLALELKSSRPDGTLIRGVHPYRQMMQYVMTGRNESIVYFDSAIDATALLRYLDRARTELEANITHCVVGAAAIGFAENPKMNRFVSGRRLYQREGVWITFTLKRKKLDSEARLATVKLEMPPGEPFSALVARINGQISEQRSGRRTYHDREYDLLSAIPRGVLRVLVGLLRQLDYWNVLPGSFIAGDALYTGLVVTNLGSLGMAAPFHHLYEWGNCPLFMMVGAVEERAVVVDGEIVVRPILPLRYAYDERIDDGLSARFGIDAVKRVLENPFEELAGLDGEE